MGMDIYFEIGRRLKELREEKQYKQSDVGEYVGLTRSSIANIEQGRQKLQIDTLYDFAFFYKVDVKEILPDISNFSKYQEKPAIKPLDDKNTIQTILNKIRERNDHES